jgi:hypothetical protein
MGTMEELTSVDMEVIIIMEVIKIQFRIRLEGLVF